MGTRLVVLLVCGAWMGASAVWAQASPGVSSETLELLERAVDDYTEALENNDRAARLGGFRNAERLFAAAASQIDTTPELQVNLGNAALAAERLGPAILAYRRALLVEPTHMRAGQNLDHARSLLPNWVPRPEPAGLLAGGPLLRQISDRSNLPFVASAVFAVAALLFAAGLRGDRAGLRLWAAVFALGWLALLAWDALDAGGSGPRSAVVIPDEATARSADSVLAPTALPQPLPGGAEVRWIESRAPWARVRLANGRDVWLLESGLAFVDERR